MKNRKNSIRRIFALSMACSVIFSGNPVYGQAEFGTGSESAEPYSEIFSSGETQDFAEESSEFFSDGEIRYIKGRPLTEEERAEQLAPMENLPPLEEATIIGSDLSRSTYALYPEKYDARKDGLVTIAKNQNPFGICWAFGMASLLETSFLAQNKGAVDLSEEHLAYFFGNRENDPLGNTEGDVNTHLRNYHEGGNDYLASIFLSTWSGMTTEKSVPLPTDSSHVSDYSAPLPREKAYEAAAYLTDASFSDYTVERMKQMVTEHHSTAIMYYMANGSKYYNPDTGAYSYPDKIGVNHVVVVVGWDDNYGKENFPEACGVTSDGAWIVKNSWGPQWGDEGYFYLSYEDKNISSLVSAEATDCPAYRNNYFYDGSTGLRTVTLKPKQSVANIFTAKAKKGCAEILGEVNVSTLSDNAQYTIQIYTDIKDEKDPTSGTPAYAAPYMCAQPLMGVKTIQVPEVAVAGGTKYSVVIKNEGADLKFCCEADSTYPWMKTTANIQRGQGLWASTKGEWTDLYEKAATPRIKAHTRTMDRIPAPVLKAASKDYNETALSWSEAAGADGYIIYRKETGKAEKKIASVSSSETSYSDTAVKTGIKYTYRVVPYVRVLGKVISGDTSNTVSAVPELSRPAFKVRAYANGYNKVTWSGVSGATEYKIYRKAPGGRWALLSTVKSTSRSYYDKKIKACASYVYTVRAYRKTSSGSFLSRYKTGDVIKAAPATQKVASAYSVSAGIKVRWNSQDKCDGYRIYRRTGSGSWKAIKTISSGSASTYLDKTARKGVSYQYAVRAYVRESYGYVYSRYTASLAVKRK